MKTSALGWLLAVSLLASAVESSIKIALDRVSPTSSMRAGLHRRQDVGQFLTNIGEVVFVGKITLGTPPQEFIILFDTGSAIMWVPSSQCNTPICNIHARYDSTKSSTFSATTMKFNESYGDGSNSIGTLSNDVLVLGGVNITNQTFGQSAGLNSNFNETKFDGILGLGIFNPNGTALENPLYVMPLQNMFQQKLIANRTFAVALHSLSNGQSQDPTGGEIIFGGINPSKFTGNLTYLSLYNQSVTKQPLFWAVPLTQIALAGQIAQVTGGVALLDTGSSFIGIPDSVAESIATLLQAFVDPFFGLAWIDCNTVGPKINGVTFFVGTTGQPFQIPAERWIAKISASDPIIQGLLQQLVYAQPTQVPPFLQAGLPQYCYLRVTTTGSELWILGDPFFETFYVVFDADNARVGIAPQTPYNPNNVTLFASQSNSVQVGPTIAGLSTSAPGATQGSGQTLPNAAKTNRVGWWNVLAMGIVGVLVLV